MTTKKTPKKTSTTLDRFFKQKPEVSNREEDFAANASVDMDIVMSDAQKAVENEKKRKAEIEVAEILDICVESGIFESEQTQVDSIDSQIPTHPSLDVLSNPIDSSAELVEAIEAEPAKKRQKLELSSDIGMDAPMTEVVENAESLVSKTPAPQLRKRTSKLTESEKAERKMAEIKNNRVIYREPKITILSRKDRVKFSEKYESLTEPLEGYPEEEYAHLAAYVEELCEPDLDKLASKIQRDICQDSIEFITITAFKDAIAKIATRKNYGIESLKKPKYAVNRWDITDLELLPEGKRAEILDRRDQREKAQAQLVADFESTPSKSVKGSRKAKAPTPAVAAIEITIVPEEEQKKEKPAKKARQSKSENLKSEKPKSARKRKSTAAAEPIAIEGSEASETASTANSDENALPTPQNKSTISKTTFPNTKSAQKLKKIEQENSQRRINSFFKPKETVPSSQMDEGMNLEDPEDVYVAAFNKLFAPFYAWGNMIIAPTNFYKLSCESQVEEYLENSMEEEIDVKSDLAAFVKIQKEYRKRNIPRSLRSLEESVCPTELQQHNSSGRWNELKKNYCFKLFQFHDNYRPAYWGSWMKTSKRVLGRTPFAKEEALNYEYDSDEDWEEGDEEGEDILSEDMDNDKEDDFIADGEEADGWLVPEGHLSDDEGLDDESPKKLADNKGAAAPKKTLLKNLEPIIVGISYSSFSGPSFNMDFEKYRAVSVIPDLTSNIDVNENYYGEDKKRKTKLSSLEEVKEPKRKRDFPEEILKDFLLFLEGRGENRDVLIGLIQERFKEHNIPKIRIDQKIKEVTKVRKGKGLLELKPDFKSILTEITSASITPVAAPAVILGATTPLAAMKIAEP